MQTVQLIMLPIFHLDVHVFYKIVTATHRVLIVAVKVFVILKLIVKNMFFHA